MTWDDSTVKETSETGKLFAKWGSGVEPDLYITTKRHFDRIREIQTGY